jgi:hypothetical protein
MPDVPDPTADVLDIVSDVLLLDQGDRLSIQLSAVRDRTRELGRDARAIGRCRAATLYGPPTSGRLGFARLARTRLQAAPARTAGRAGAIKAAELADRRSDVGERPYAPRRTGVPVGLWLEDHVNLPLSDTKPNKDVMDHGSRPMPPLLRAAWIDETMTACLSIRVLQRITPALWPTRYASGSSPL